jgi:hypothetical protein
MLEQVHDILWIADGEIVNFWGFPFPTRSVVARLGNGDLWIWSPVKLTSALRAELDRLGPVRHLVSPNKMHHLHLREWNVAYPQALLWGPRSTVRKRSDLAFREPLQDAAPSEWQPDIDQAWFRGSFAMDEVVFFHRPSRAVLVADLIAAFSDRFLSEHWSWWQRPIAAAIGMAADKPHAPLDHLDWQLSFVNRVPARAARAKVLSWPCERVIMAHGEWRRSDGHAFLESSFSWLG